MFVYIIVSSLSGLYTSQIVYYATALSFDDILTAADKILHAKVKFI